MDGTSLERWQAERLRDAIRPRLAYVRRLRVRMERRGFPGTDILYQLVRRVEDDLQALFVELHYLSCASGVGRKTE
jgi:hypothetical protein